MADQGSKGDTPSNARTTQTDAPQAGIGITAPSISLPKGGGAIRGMGEKFAANPVTGTGSMTVPIATSPGRSGFGPQLLLSYDSGAGNGPFGFGWSLSLPSITRKTDKGLPQYADAEESDVFILSGAEDLVPEFEKVATDQKDATDQWVLKDGKQVIHEKQRTVNGVTYLVRRYGPRSEGLFARIERWTNVGTGETHWRSISKDNITTLYGKDNNARIFDPADPNQEHPTRIFTWLISESYDDKGNAIRYTYKAEDAQDVDRTAVHERNRLNEATFAQRYLKRIHYGNRTPRLANEDLQQRRDWLFEVVFDYGEHYQADPQHQTILVDVLGDQRTWAVRADAFSTCRAGFEVRTYRLCQRVLMFHHFPADDPADVDEAAVGKNCLVRATEFSHEQTPMATYLVATTQAAFRRNGTGYTRRSLPPLQFEYSKAEIQAELKTVDAASLENLPSGIDGAHYQFVDMYGEGIAGVLTQQAEGWFYKRNLSPLTMQTVHEANGKAHITIDARFAPLERVALRPSPGNLNGDQQLLDLDGDGRTDLVQFAPPLAGYSAQNSAGGWQPFVPFRSQPNLDWHDPNLRHVELTGDGHADLLITRNNGFEWYRSLEKDGFDPAQFVTQPLDDEQGPRLVFADGTQSVYLADMNGDGLTDLLRIGNGNVCYWSSLGYGRFGAKVTMSHAPHFDHPDQFDHQRIRLADIDGSGVVDILYIGRDAIQVYRNEAGNRWADADRITVFPRVDNLASVQAMDLLGNGTACLVWSSPLSKDARQPMRYLDLLGGQKPHLLIKTSNNLGAETAVQYAPSTKFYLQDKYAGKPWITKLPFPVHVVEKVTVTDKWRKTTFASSYSYHHGYFDGNEREFRGFGRVEQVDVESYGEFEQGNATSPYITDDKTLYQPPIKTITWFHTGAFLDREQILSHFQQEYFAPSSTDFHENELPQPDLASQGLATAEWRQALRACKGMTLRQEVYELDVDALERGEERRVKLFSTAFHNCHIQRLQPQASNRHAVFLATESEAITYTYELDLRLATLTPDPRIAHNLNLKVDALGNVLQSVAVVYPRIGNFEDDPNLAAGLTAALPLIHRVQKEETHVAYSETRYTDDFGDEAADASAALDNHRLRVPCEVLTYELTGIAPARLPYFTLAELRGYDLSNAHPTTGTLVEEIAYHELPARPIPDPPHPDRLIPQKRWVEHARMLFFKDDPTDPAALKEPLPFGQLSRLGLPYETYKLALTKELLNAVFSDASGNKLDLPVRDTLTARQMLSSPAISGYLSGAELALRFPSIPASERDGQYWMRSGTAGFESDAARHFYLPENYTDPFGNSTTLKYDEKYDLFIQSSKDARDNVTRVTKFDYRVLAPAEMEDINGNRTEAWFDGLGMVVAVAVKGKGGEADNLDDYDDEFANPSLADILNYFDLPPLTADQARTRFNPILGNATTRFLYHFGEQIENGKTVWASRPAGACAIVREQHVADVEKLRLTDPAAASPLQIAFECSDGMGTVLMKRSQAEPETVNGTLRWIASGKTVLNNKGKPVKQYEPYFTIKASCCAEGDDHEEVGVTPLMYYDAPGRLVRTELPDGTLSRVEFSPWHVKTFDANDTIYEPNNAWYARHTAAGASVDDKRAAKLSLAHQDTPALTILDSLGREVIAIAHNRVEDANGTRQIDGKNYRDERYLTFTKLDAEGKPLWIRDERGHLVMQYIRPAKANNDPSDLMPAAVVPCYDIAGNLLFQHSMDAGDRWMINDAAGKPMVAWDFNIRNLDNGGTRPEERLFHTRYDSLHRPVAQWLKINTEPAAMIEAFTYSDTANFTSAVGVVDRVALDAAQQRNLIGQATQHYDPSGLATVERVDFKGAAEEITRTLVKAVDAPIVDWNRADRATLLEAETFIQITEHDALGRMTRHYNWHIESPTDPGTSERVAVYLPHYNRRGALERETLLIHARKIPGDHEEAAGITRSQPAIKNITYNAKGQKTSLELGNGTTTRYTYDAETFRLVHLYTRRDARFPLDCVSDPDAERPPLPCGVQNLHYTYDPVGNITHIQDDAQQTIWFANQQVEPSSDYSYDALYRLIEATGRENGALRGAPANLEDSPVTAQLPIQHTDPNALSNYTQTYRYDPVGNIKQMSHVAGIGSWTRDYTYATDSNRLLSTQQGGEAIIYDYDPHGNMRNLANVPDAYRMQWDHRDMIAKINLGGGGQAYYQYDAGKQRTRKRIENQNGLGGYWERIYLGGYELYRRYQPNNPKPIEEIESLHLFEGEQRVLLVDDVLKTDRTHADGRLFKTAPILRYQYSNHLGSVGVELDESAQVISYEEFHPYGTSAYRLLNSATEAPAKRYRYTRMERDEESGLSYHGARYYAPWLGRWTSADPGGMVDGVCLYQYVRSNPIKYYDSSGQFLQGTYVIIEVVAPSAAPVVAGVGATVATGASLLILAVGAIPGMLILGHLDIESRKERYEAEGKEGHAKYLEGIPKEHYVGTPSAASEKVKAQLLGTAPALAVAKQQGPKPDPKPEKPLVDPIPPPPPDEDNPKRMLVYATYWKGDTETGKLYAGRTRGWGTSDMDPRDIARMAVANRDLAHDEKTGEGYGIAILDEFTVATIPVEERREDPAYQAIRGREQQMIDLFGGAWSDTYPNRYSANKIRGVAPNHEFGREYHDQATLRFNEELHPYTGD